MMNSHDERVGLDWEGYVQRYQRGEWRAPIFRDMILDDLERLGPPGSQTLLDIGCGRGFDDEPDLQAALADRAGRCVGVEPDEAIANAGLFAEVHHCLFEEAPIEPGSVDLAFAVMVLEHVRWPEAFWEKLHEVLRDGGVFWGFTIDARHWFATASMLTTKLGVKDWYLDRLHGQRRQERYENYPVYYRSNTPEQIERLAHHFQAREARNFRRLGQLDFYLPSRLWRLGQSVERYFFRWGRPGNLLVVRAVK